MRPITFDPRAQRAHATAKRRNMVTVAPTSSVALDALRLFAYVVPVMVAVLWGLGI